MNTSLLGKTASVGQMSTLPWVVEGSYIVSEFKITIHRYFLGSSQAEKVKLLQKEATYLLHHIGNITSSNDLDLHTYPGFAKSPRT